MTITALSVITSAYKRLNRLSPGEALSADDAASGFDVLNELVDEMSAQGQFLYRTVLTSVVQTGNITLGTGSWAAIASGSDIIGATSDALELSPITMDQYSRLYDTTTSGAPSLYAHDGLSTVYLNPVANGQTIVLQTRIGVAAFADQTTAYTVPQGYQSALAAALAVRIAPNVLGAIPPYLLKAEQKAMASISKYQPKILNVGSYSCNTVGSNILNG